MDHRNPSRKKVSFPICGIGNPKATPYNKKSYSFKNTHQLSRTKSPSDYLQFPEDTEDYKIPEREKEKEK